MLYLRDIHNKKLLFYLADVLMKSFKISKSSASSLRVASVANWWTDVKWWMFGLAVNILVDTSRTPIRETGSKSLLCSSSNFLFLHTGEVAEVAQFSGFLRPVWKTWIESLTLIFGNPILAIEGIWGAHKSSSIYLYLLRNKMGAREREGKKRRQRRHREGKDRKRIKHLYLRLNLGVWHIGKLYEGNDWVCIFSLMFL